MALLSFQKPAHHALVSHFKSREVIEWNGIKIHPPIVVNASVSSGKSIMICETAKTIIDDALAKTKPVRTRVLVIQRQGELCSQNSEAAWSIGLQNSIYSASAQGGKRSTHYDVVYATEGTLARALDQKFRKKTDDDPDGGWHPDLILIDECHQTPWDDEESQFMRILRHFYECKPWLRLGGFTGSPFRGAESIIGPFWHGFAQLDADLVAENGYVGDGIVSTEWMLRNGWICPIQWGWPESEEEDSYDFSGLEPNGGFSESGTSDFNEKEMQERVADVAKTYRICHKIVEQTVDRLGVLIFASTKRHLRDVKKGLMLAGIEEDQIGCITESTTTKERAGILERAKNGLCKYVINLTVLTTGVNVPRWDSVYYLRPIGSLVLLIQSLGRGLRLLLPEGISMLDLDKMTVDERLALIAGSEKPFTLIGDFAGVMDRLGALYENPILEEAERSHAEKKKELIECPICSTMNSIHARRCIGETNRGDRCEYFWKYQVCPGCATQNDVVARECRSCHRELVDPNAKLNHKAYTDSELSRVISMNLTAGGGGKLILRYMLEDGREPLQIFYPNHGKTAQSALINTRIWYQNFVKHHTKGDWAHKARGMKAEAAEKMQAMFARPTYISARYSEDSGKWNIGRRVFSESGMVEADEYSEEGADA